MDKILKWINSRRGMLVVVVCGCLWVSANPFALQAHMVLQVGTVQLEVITRVPFRSTGEVRLLQGGQGQGPGPGSVAEAP